MHFRFSFFSLILVLVWPAMSSAQNILARAEANPSVVMIGESANYSVLFINTTSLPNINTPRVDGLDFSDRAGTSTMQRIINGRMTVEVKLTWNFRPTRTGTFTIPGRQIRVDGQMVDIPAVEVQAVPKSEEAKSRAFIRIQMPDPPYYVGQALPARVNVYIRQDLSISNIDFPDIEGDLFVHSEFNNNPRRLSVQHEGIPYDVLAWDILITPIKSGSAELVIGQNIVIQIPVSDGRFPSIFSMRQAKAEKYSLQTDPLEMDILPLPELDRPASFSGAIGQFEVSLDLASSELTVGEPVTITLNLAGRGNFERIAPLELPEWENWRFYPPKVNFVPADDRGLAGTKSFEYILIPQSEDITEIPELTYSTFDPKTAEYVTTVLPAEPISVQPSPDPVETNVTLPAFGQEEKPELKVPDTILSLKPNPGTLLPNSSRFWMNRGFLATNGLVALGLLSLASWQKRRQRLLTDDHLARRHAGSRKVRMMLQKCQQAVRNGDPETFFRSARFCIAESTSHLTRSAPDAQSLVSSDCLEFLRQANAPESIIKTVSDILDAADSYQFAGSVPESGRLQALHTDLSAVIPQLNRLKK